MVPAHKFPQPPRHIVREFLEHIKRVGDPLTWRFHSHFAPPPGDVEVLNADFRIPRRFPHAACPICNRTEQYRHGHLIWSPITLTVHAVGNCCGETHFTEGLFAARLGTARRDQNRQEREDFALANWRTVQALISASERLQPQARLYDKLASAIRGCWSSRVCREVYSMAENFGVLVLYGRMSDAAEFGFGQAAVIPYSKTPFRGHSVLAVSRSKPSLEGRTMSATIPLRPFDWESELAALDCVLALTDAELALLVTSTEFAVRELERIRNQITQMHEFLAPDNIALINGWSRAFDSGTTIGLSRRGNETVTVWKNGRAHRKLSLPALFWDPPTPLPSIVAPRYE